MTSITLELMIWSVFSWSIQFQLPKTMHFWLLLQRQWEEWKVDGNLCAIKEWIKAKSPCVGGGLLTGNSLSNGLKIHETLFSLGVFCFTKKADIRLLLRTGARTIACRLGLSNDLEAAKGLEPSKVFCKGITSSMSFPDFLCPPREAGYFATYEVFYNSQVVHQ